VEFAHILFYQGKLPINNALPLVIVVVLKLTKFLNSAEIQDFLSQRPTAAASQPLLLSMCQQVAARA
jgi:hypothetical protein